MSPIKLMISSLIKFRNSLLIRAQLNLVSLAQKTIALPSTGRLKSLFKLYSSNSEHPVVPVGVAIDTLKP